jgi:phosphoserine phosphatase
LAIATLIAAGRLDERLHGRWIEPGSAIDLDASALEGLDRHGADLIPLPHGRDIRLFVADMDSTMIGQECIDELADYAGFKPEVAAITERAMQGELDFRSALAERVALLKGLDEAVIGQCIAERIRPNPGAKTLVSTLRAHGIRTVLVSGGFTAFAGPIGADLGFDRVVANVLGAANGKLTGKTVGAVVDAEAKKSVLLDEAAALGIGPEQTMAIGDGANDIPLVEAAGLGIAYRAKPALIEVADARLDHHPLDALLWALAIPSTRWVDV